MRTSLDYATSAPWSGRTSLLVPHVRTAKSASVLFGTRDTSAVLMVGLLEENDLVSDKSAIAAEARTHFHSYMEQQAATEVTIR